MLLFWNMIHKRDRGHRVRRTIAGLAAALATAGPISSARAEPDPLAAELHQGFLQQHDANTKAAESILLGKADCNTDPIYAALIMMPDLELRSAQHELRLRYPDGPGDMQLAASDYNLIAGATAKRGCLTKAREIYLHVIETFSGKDYAEIRQRARAGADDLHTVEQPKRKARPRGRSHRPSKSRTHIKKPVTHRLVNRREK